MNSRFTIVEMSLNRAEFRWKWLKFLEHSFLLGGVLCLVVLLFGGAIVLGWVASKALATTVFAAVGVVGFIGWTIIVISVMAGTPDRGWLAAAVERVDRRLLDRLNTLLFLERRRGDAPQGDRLPGALPGKPRGCWPTKHPHPLSQPPARWNISWHSCWHS